MSVYTRAQLQNYIWDQVIFRQISTQIDSVSAINAGVKRAWSEVDLRSAKRLSSIIQLFNDVYDYFCPVDLKDQAIIDIVPQVNRSRTFDPELVSAAEFDQRKGFEKNIVAFNDHDLVRKLRVAINANTTSLVISNLDSLMSGSQTTNWVAYGDATNLRVDNQNFVEGSGALMFDISGNANSFSGIQNTALNTFDLTNYMAQGSIFAYAYLSDTSHVTSFELIVTDIAGKAIFGSVTQTNEGASFYQGWQLLRWDINSLTKVSGFNPAACQQVKLYLNNNASKDTQTQFRFDIIMAANGAFNNVLYYSKYPWNLTGGAGWANESSASGDQIVCDDDELPMIVSACRVEADRRLRDWNAYEIDSAQYERDKAAYIMKYASERKSRTSTYYDFNAGLGMNTDLDVIIQQPDQNIDGE